jgi:glycosyltransferase involved in cell wall biosynthesis
MASGQRQPINIVFATGTDELNQQMVGSLRQLSPNLPTYFVSDFRPEESGLKWIPYHPQQGLSINLARCRAAFEDKQIRFAAMMLVPDVPFRMLRVIALLTSASRLLIFNENLNHFMLRPQSVPAMVRHGLWRVSNRLRAPARAASEEIATPADRAVVFAGMPSRNLPCVFVVSPYIPFPLSHGGAVRIFNLMRRAAAEFDQVLVTFIEELDTPPREILEICKEVILVSRTGSHAVNTRTLPDTVDEFDSAVFRAALKAAVDRHRPSIAQLEFTQMAQYAKDCGSAKTILVEHDITFDLYRQQLSTNNDWDLHRQFQLWQKFETQAWAQVDRVVTMSEKDSRTVGGKAVELPNGVDLARFQPSEIEPEPRRLLFIGSFAHLPNLLALEFFLTRVWPLLENVTLHIIGGARHEYFLDLHRESAAPNLAQPGIEIEGFVSDVRPAYTQASVVLAPLLASAGTNLKVLEAMAMGKAVVSTSSGVNGLAVTSGKDLLITDEPDQMAIAIQALLADSDRRNQLGREARKTVERSCGWDAIAARAAALYRELAN